MTQDRPTGTPVPEPRPGGNARQDDLAERVTAALRSREPDAAGTAATARRIAARLEAADGRSEVVTPFARRAGTIAVTGVVVSALGVVGAGAAAAANPYTEFAAAVDGVAHAVGVDWSSMPDGYTREQYDAFWGAEYTAADLEELRDLWNVDSLEAKARAGQMILDGETPPVAPDPTKEVPFLDPADQEVFREAGYTIEDAQQLAELWQIDIYEAKARAADMLLDGETPPVP
ncbi:hypothetical protein C8K30_11033 [Promicromonospora sp. AC04]|uniref:hypothetical protein n=1 Tax=Promicromonospora sp. AC04 TaxID=2135723 RepID=UPI000D36425F|nr:hypothetical protein [Promicromonospora sp. AC04]PUB23894.1 hypothetical protein C8K30_11033 [Promicromonospora sp. AC04]